MLDLAACKMRPANFWLLICLWIVWMYFLHKGPTGGTKFWGFEGARLQEMAYLGVNDEFIPQFLIQNLH